MLVKAAVHVRALTSSANENGTIRALAVPSERSRQDLRAEMRKLPRCVGCYLTCWFWVRDYMCGSTRVQLRVQVHGDQRTTSGIGSQMPLTLVWEAGPHTALAWLANEPRDHPVSTSPALGLQTTQPRSAFPHRF